MKKSLLLMAVLLSLSTPALAEDAPTTTTTDTPVAEQAKEIHKIRKEKREEMMKARQEKREEAMEARKEKREEVKKERQERRAKMKEKIENKAGETTTESTAE